MVNNEGRVGKESFYNTQIFDDYFLVRRYYKWSNHTLLLYRKFVDITILTILLYLLYLLLYSQKQLPSAWNESDWLANCRPIHIVKLRENRKRFSWKLYKFMAYKVFWRMTSIRKIRKQNACLHAKKRVFHCNYCNALYINVHFTAYQWHSKRAIRPGRQNWGHT